MRSMLLFAAAPALISTATGAQSIQHDYHLDNGLRVVLVEDHSTPIITVDIWYNVGSANEVAGRTGFAHLFEHMMFQGSQRAPKGEHTEVVESAGGISNATTNKDRTNYFQTVPANLLETVLWYEADRMRGLDVSQENLDNQREAVKEERRMRLDNQPYAPSFQFITDAPFDDAGCFAYSHELIGSMEDLDAATVADVQAFFDLYYTPNNATLTIVGDFEPARATEIVERFFGGIARGDDTPAAGCEWTIGTEPRDTEWDDPLANLSAAFVSYPLPAHKHDDTPAVDLLGVILGAGESSRLNRSMVREAQTALQTQAFTIPQRWSSLFIVVAIANQGVDAPTLATQLRAELDDIANNGVSDEELEKAKNSYRAGDIFGKQTTSQVAENIQHYVHFHDSLDDMYTDLDRYMEVTVDDIRRVAALYLSATNANAVLVKPATGGERPVPDE